MNQKIVMEERIIQHPQHGQIHMYRRTDRSSTEDICFAVKDAARLVGRKRAATPRGMKSGVFRGIIVDEDGKQRRDMVNLCAAGNFIDYLTEVSHIPQRGKVLEWVCTSAASVWGIRRPSSDSYQLPADKAPEEEPLTNSFMEPVSRQEYEFSLDNLPGNEKGTMASKKWLSSLVTHYAELCGMDGSEAWRALVSRYDKENGTDLWQDKKQYVRDQGGTYISISGYLASLHQLKPACKLIKDMILEKAGYKKRRRK